MSFDKPGKVEKSYSDVISSISEIIDDARNGRMFILVDHEDRENEGDLVIPAQMRPLTQSILWRRTAVD